MERKPHVLIIDDDFDISRLFGGKLTREGFDIMYAPEGNEGRELARRFQPDLILLDFRLPGDDGLAVAQRLKEEQLTKHIPIILLTNEDLTREAAKAIKELWIAEYIHKSIPIHELAPRLKEILKNVIGQSEKNASEMPAA